MKGIIFDLDGTLVNTLADINHAVNAMLEDYGIPVQTFEDTKNHLGLGFEFLVEQSLPENKKDLFEEEFKDLIIEEQVDLNERG